MNRTRFFVVIVVMFVSALAVAGRIARIMIVEHDQWFELACRQQQQTVTAQGTRGSILSADGYVLAASLECSALQVDTHVLSYPELFAPAAADLLGMTADDVLVKLRGKARAVWLAKQVDSEIAEEVRKLAPSAVVVVPDSRRVYPLGEVAAPVIGFVGREELSTVGRYGFEYKLNDDLTGKPGRYLVLRDAIQRQIRLQTLEAATKGVDVHLSLNAQLQARCEAILHQTLESIGGTSASAVVVEAYTGVVRALVSMPSYNPAAPGDDERRWRLVPVQDAFEPGSTVKPFIVALGLAYGVVDSQETFDCRRRGITVAGKWIRDHAEPDIYSVDGVVIHSANVGVIEMAERIDPAMLWRGFDLFGFGHPTGIQFPAEAEGLMNGVDSWSTMSRSGFALGQELTASPLQVAMAYAAIANGGWLVQPKLIEDVSLASEPKDARRILDLRLARRLQSMLEGVVTEGTGREAEVDGMRVAGKTGTAQKAVSGGFDDEHHAAWFAGFLPMPDPQYVVVVMVDEPEKDFWASSVAAPAFARISEAVAHVFGIPRADISVVGSEA